MPESRLKADLLLSHVTNLPRIALYTEFERPVTRDEQVAFREALVRAGNAEPLQYITGETEFYGYRIQVDRRVLIPRPETEGLVEHLLHDITVRYPSGGRVLEVGVGAAPIMVALGHHLTADWEICGIDVSAPALEVAAQNLSLHQLAKRVELIQTSLFDWHPNRVFDVIVANPPYIDISQKKDLPMNVVRYEPESALFDGGDGLSFYRQLARRQLVHAESTIYCEIPEDRTSELKAIFAATFASVRIDQDLNGKDRYLTAGPAPAQHYE